MIVRRVCGLGVLLVAVGALAVLVMAPAGADISWTGQGVSVPDECTGTGNTEVIHFILTSPAGSSSTLTITTNPGGTQQVVGEQSGNGSIQFFVQAPAGATITLASATGNTDNSNLTISGCTLTTTNTTTTTTSTTTTTTATTATTGAPAAIRPSTVTVTPRLTG